MPTIPTATTRNPLAERYHDALDQHGVTAEQVVTTALGHVDLLATSYRGRCLSRPAFLSSQEQTRLAGDLDQLLAALTALPDTRFGGDLSEFARAVGMIEPQVAAIVRGSGSGPTRLGRADLYHDGTGFRLMELNLSSATGSLDNALLNRAFVAHPAVAEFTTEHRLSYVDTLAEVADTLRAECGVPEGQRPFVAAVDWPDSFPELEARLRTSAAAQARYGLDMAACHLGQLALKDGRVWLDGRPVDVIYRIFLLEDLASPEGPALIEPVLRAVERGEVKLFAPLESELFGSKAALAMLSDEAYRPRLAPEQLASLDRILPWTRTVRPGDVTVDGERVDLLEYALGAREELVLKPAHQHGGSGVVLGWRVEPDQWRRQVQGALGRPYVLQRRVRGVPELFPSGGELQPRLLSWGVFTCHRGYGGAVVRGTPDVDGDVVVIARGATAGSCFHQQSG